MKADRTTRELLLLKQQYNIRDDDPIFLFFQGYGKLQERMFHNINGATSLAMTLSSNSRIANEKYDELITAAEGLTGLSEELSRAEAFYFAYKSTADAMLAEQKKVMEEFKNFDTTLMQTVVEKQMKQIGANLVNQMDRALRRSLQENERLKKKVVEVAAISSGLTAVIVAILMLVALK